MKFQKNLVYLMIATLFLSFSCGKNKVTISDTVTDIDGNVYHTVKIGSQVWMVENLKVTHYRNGDPIPNVTVDSTWYRLRTGAYCNYNNDPGYVSAYGQLYNWYAVKDPRGLEPKGWHVPTDEDWKQLEMYLGISQSHVDLIGYRGNNEGGKMKSTGTREGGDGLWHSPNEGATNESGFSALPGGFRDPSNGGFAQMGNVAVFWSSSEGDRNIAWIRGLDYNHSRINRDSGGKKAGLSVRCIRN